MRGGLRGTIFGNFCGLGLTVYFQNVSRISPRGFITAYRLLELSCALGHSLLGVSIVVLKIDNLKH